jgi:hypothetical protein
MNENRQTDLRLSRRSFLGGMADVVAGLASVSFLWRISRKDDFIAAAVKRRLPTLSIADADLRRYAADYRGASSQGQLKVIAMCALLTPLYRFAESRGRATPLSDLETRLAQTFLLSTDLFPDGNDAKPIRYVRLYDPYLYACSDPFQQRARGA